MKWYAKILLWPIVAVNLLVALLLIGCAYSPILPVASMPLLSLAGLAMPFVLAANLLFLFIWILLYRPFMWVPIVTIIICFPQIRAFSPININNQQTPKDGIKLLQDCLREASRDLWGGLVGVWGPRNNGATSPGVSLEPQGMGTTLKASSSPRLLPQTLTSLIPPPPAAQELREM